jgi:hypothetical protein
MNPLSRRSLLKAASLLPLLPQLARAQVAPPKRLLVVFSPLGYLESAFWPKDLPGGGFDLGETMTALNPYKSKLIYPDGIFMHGGVWYLNQGDGEHGYGMANVFTGSRKGQTYAGGPSIDQVVANHLFAQQPTAFRSLSLGVNAGSPNAHSSCFLSAPGTPVNPQNSPAAAYESVFKNVVTSGPGPAPDMTAAIRLRKQKQSVLQMVRGEVNALCKRIGAQEKEKCEAHLAGLEQLERQLPSVTPVGPVTGCEKPAVPTGAELVSNIHQQMDIISAAFACDLTRVATLQLGFADGGLSPFPNINQHDTTHSAGNNNGAYTQQAISDHKTFDRWFADQWAYLLGKLSAVQESNGSLLDNTLVLFGSDTTSSTSPTQGAHSSKRFPYFLAGGGNFAFPTGRHLIYAPADAPTPRYDDMIKPAYASKVAVGNRLLVSIAQKFGITANTFGDFDPGSGGLPML